MLLRNLKNLRYIARHKYFVFRAGLITGTPIFLLLIHDWSKFTPTEWRAYREHFYGEASEKVYRDFKYAWLAHQRRNKHHWQYWLLQEDSGQCAALDMPEKYIREMVADWVGAGRAIYGKVEVRSWYSRNRDKMILSDNTRRRVEQLIELF